MSLHRSRIPATSDSGYSSTASTPSPDRSKGFKLSGLTKHHASSKNGSGEAIADDLSLLSIATRIDLTTSIGTELANIQVSDLDGQQLNELATLVSERGVVFLRNQNLTRNEHLWVFDHFGKKTGKYIIEKDERVVWFKRDSADFGEALVPVDGGRADWSSDRSYEAEPSSYSMLKAEDAEGDTTWVSHTTRYR